MMNLEDILSWWFFKFKSNNKSWWSKFNNYKLLLTNLEQIRNDKINFNDVTITANVDQIVGQPIVSVGTTNTIVNNLKFSILDGKVTGVSTIPHGLSDGDIVEISGISSITYKNIEGVNTIGLSTVTSSLSEAIPNLATTGITTFITFSDPNVNRKFEKNDVIQLILNNF